MRTFQSLSIFIFGLFLLTSCEGYFGEKTDLDFIEIPEYSTRQAAYVPIQPILDDFVYPTDVIAGFDNLIYVVDAGTEEIVALDEAGNILGSYYVPGVHSITQDRSFDLLAIGTKDTLIAGTTYSLSCIYRIELKGTLGYGINHAKVQNKIIHPFYYKNSFSASDANVTFTSVAILSTNEFYVTRKGDRNTLTQYGGPDNAVLLFSEEDEYSTPISITSDGAIYRDYFNYPEAVITSAVPPQINVTETRDFSVVVSGDESSIKYRYIQFNQTEEGSSYTPSGNVEEDTTQAEGFITEQDKFVRPVDITVTGDGTNYIFIADTETDSVYQFTGTGLEGVQPPAGAYSDKYVKVSFGGTGVGATQFVDPMGVAYLNEILYVADSGNGRVLRFKLTLDFD